MMSKAAFTQQMVLTLLSLLFLTAGRPGLSGSSQNVYDLPPSWLSSIPFLEDWKYSSNFQLFYFNYCYNEASCLGALSRYQIKREETSEVR